MEEDLGAATGPGGEDPEAAEEEETMADLQSLKDRPLEFIMNVIKKHVKDFQIACGEFIDPFKCGPDTKKKLEELFHVKFDTENRLLSKEGGEVSRGMQRVVSKLAQA